MSSKGIDPLYVFEPISIVTFIGFSSDVDLFESWRLRFRFPKAFFKISVLGLLFRISHPANIIHEFSKNIPGMVDLECGILSESPLGSRSPVRKDGNIKPG